MRAVKNNLPTPSGEVEESKALVRANGTSRRASGWAGENVARSWDHPSHPLVKGGKGSLAAALPVERHVLACRGWAGENNGHFEHLARHVAMRRKLLSCWALFLKKAGAVTRDWRDVSGSRRYAAILVRSRFTSTWAKMTSGSR